MLGSRVGLLYLRGGRESRDGFYMPVSFLAVEKRVKVLNLFAPTKKGLASKFAKPKPAKKGGDTFESCERLRN